MNEAGKTDPSALSDAEWAELRSSFGNQRLLGMDYYSGGHLTHGASVREACMRAVYLEKAAQTQHLAWQGGAARPLDGALARKLGTNAPYDLLYEFSWNYYERRIQALSPDFKP